MNYYPKYPAPPTTLQKPYSVTVLGKPYMSQLSRVSPLAAASDYAAARSRDYHSSVADDLHNATFGKKQWRRPRYFPVSVWCPSHDFSFDTMPEVRSYHRPPAYMPEYEPVYRSGYYSPRVMSTSSTTVTRTGPRHDFEYDMLQELRLSRRPASYIPEYEPVMTTGSYGYTPRWYSTANPTLIRTGPYGTRTYRY